VRAAGARGVGVETGCRAEGETTLGDKLEEESSPQAERASTRALSAGKDSGAGEARRGMMQLILSHKLGSGGNPNLHVDSNSRKSRQKLPRYFFCGQPRPTACSA